MPPSRKGLVAALGLGVAVTGLSATASPALANPAGTGLVISEVFGAGGNIGATYNADIVELYTPTTAAITVDGLGVQYRSAGGSSGGVAALTGRVPAGHHFLVQMSTASATNGAALPTPDVVSGSNIAMSGSNGQVLLLPGTTASTASGDLAGNPGVIDAVGFGTTPTSYEGAATGVALTSTTSAQRTATGADSDNNADDFSEALPTPENAGGSAPPEEFTGSIAEIQGTDTGTTPHAGDIVTTTGVVTAAYPTGGFNGFYLQTPGTGGTTDATPGASDAIFVYGSAATATVAVGDHVRVVGLAKEFGGETEIETHSADNVTPLTGTVPVPQALVTDYPTGDAAREAHEGELLDLSAQHFTVSSNYATNQYAEIGLATGDRPLVAPTETTDAQDTAGIAAATAANAARAVTLDDGASINFLPFGGGDNMDIPLPWLSPGNPVRVSSRATFHEPVVLDYRNNTWKLQPTHQVTDEGADVATFSDTRAENAAPQDVGGDLRLATFNVLNYFPTTGADFVASGAGTCSYYYDRTGTDPVTDNRCDPEGPRGAAEDEDLQRQQAKIVTAINTLDADVVSLEEIENSVKFGEDRDAAVSTLVAALNADAGTTRWAFAPSPAAADLPAPADQDVIRTAFIYDPSTVDLVGASDVLTGSAPFADAREPLAQAFKPHGADDATAFGVIVNHFKSKGSGADDGTGQGNANPDRVAQAEALSTFADGFEAERGISRLFLSGDFNAYTTEDPIQALEAHGYTNLVSDQADEYSYNFGGMDGSLDHVFANDAARADVTGVDIWNINADESVAFEYSRDNYNATDFYRADQFRASDHDPEVVGIDVPGFPVEAAASTVTARAGKVTYGSGGDVTVTVTSANDPSGSVSVLEGERLLGSATLGDGTATVSLGKHALRPGRHQLSGTYSGDEDVAAGSTELAVDVANARATPTPAPGTAPDGR